MYLGYINSVLNPLIYDMDLKSMFGLSEFRNWKYDPIKSKLAFVNDEFQRSLRRAIRDFTLRRSNLNVSNTVWRILIYYKI